MGEDVQKIVGKRWGGAYKWLLMTWWGIWGHFFWVIIEARILKTLRSRASWIPFISFVPSRLLTPLQMLSGSGKSLFFRAYHFIRINLLLRYLFLIETAFVRSVIGSAYCWIFQPFKFLESRHTFAFVVVQLEDIVERNDVSKHCHGGKHRSNARMKCWLVNSTYRLRGLDNSWGIVLDAEDQEVIGIALASRASNLFSEGSVCNTRQRKSRFSVVHIENNTVVNK